MLQETRLNLPELHVSASREISYQISGRRFGQPVSDLDSLVSGFTTFQHANYSSVPYSQEKHEYENWLEEGR